jgi:aliphatic nitrilase
VFLDLTGSVDKACSVIKEAAGKGAGLVAFPEAFIPAFPVWCALRSPVYNHDLFCLLAEGSILVDGPEIAQIRRTAREHEVLVSLGFNERSEASVGSIWNSNVLIGENGNILNHHRKIVPTFYEKLIWANGDGAGLRVSETPLGRVGMLICGENTNPLARYTLMAQGEQLHIATYPPVWPTTDPKEGANYDLTEAIQIRAGAHSFEAKAFTLAVSAFMDAPTHDRLASLSTDAARILDGSPRGVSMLVGPDGRAAGEIRCEDEGILYEEIDLSLCVAPKQFHDVVGHYNRFDIFKLEVNRSSQRPVIFEDGAGEGEEGFQPPDTTPNESDPD